MQRILCSTDLSDYAAPALACGAELARHFGAQLIVFYTIASDDNRLYGPDVLDRTGKLEEQAARPMLKFPPAWHPTRLTGSRLWSAVIFRRHHFRLWIWR